MCIYNKLSIKQFFLFILSGLIWSSSLYSQNKDYIRPEIDGPVLGAEEAISKMHVAEGFELNLFAAEPHVINPVVIRFDHLGRLWVVEMVGYMNNLKGTKEMDKVGRISILEDSDGDGKMDKSTVFLDQLVEPRALAFHKNGILWADHKSLYHTGIVNGYKPGETVLVDGGYASGHSVEHKPNGLIRAIDNWYYNAKSNYRYKEVDGKWVIEKSEFRGQFGLSADKHGRLYHGQQNTLLRAEIFPPNFFMRNPRIDLRMRQLATQFNVLQKNCFNIKACEEAVFPVRTSRDIRDGYLKSKDCDIKVDGMAFRCTSACSHFYYRDNYFPDNYNVFIVDPAMHFVKAVTITRKDGLPHGKNVFANQEVLASPDTRFRPVDAQSAPDGTLYIADMYHGVLQHRFFMNAHLEKFILKNKLETPVDLGRIYRLTVKDKKPNSWKPFVSYDVNFLVESLGSDNPWQRDTAQRILVDTNPSGSKEALENFFSKTESVLGKIHSLWTLDAIGTVSENLLLQALSDTNRDVKIHGTRVSWRNNNSAALLSSLIKAVPKKFDESSYYMYQRLANFENEGGQKFLAKEYAKWATKPLMAKVLLSGASEKFDSWIANLPDSENKTLMKKTYYSAKVVNKNIKPELQKQYLESYNRGKIIYLQNCFSCHGKDGRGLLDMGPPLHKSDWVGGKAEIIAKIILKGMQGEITVSGKKYKPKIPMLAFEAIMSDLQIADVMTFIRNSWGNRFEPVDEGFVKNIREKIADQKTQYLESDLR